MTALTFAWAAYRSGSLMMSMGLHFGNNSFLIFAVSSRDDVLNGPAPFAFGGADLSSSTAGAGLQLALSVLAVEWYVRRRARRSAQVAAPTAV